MYLASLADDRNLLKKSQNFSQRVAINSSCELQTEKKFLLIDKLFMFLLVVKSNNFIQLTHCFKNVSRSYNYQIVINILSLLHNLVTKQV